MGVSKFFLVAFCLFQLVQLNLSIKCYVCNSLSKMPRKDASMEPDCPSCPELKSEDWYRGSACADPLDTSKIIPMDCGPGFDYCVKIRQTTDVSEPRIARQCGKLDNETIPYGKDKTASDYLTCIERTGTYRIKSLFCHCEGDFCNDGAFVKGSLFLMIFAFVVKYLS